MRPYRPKVFFEQKHSFVLLYLLIDFILIAKVKLKKIFFKFVPPKGKTFKEDEFNDIDFEQKAKSTPIYNNNENKSDPPVIVYADSSKDFFGDNTKTPFFILFLFCLFQLVWYFWCFRRKKQPGHRSNIENTPVKKNFKK